MPSAFVTGGTGFIGRHLMDVLTEQGWQIRALHRTDSDLSSWYGKPITPVQGDLADADALKAAIPKNCDTLFHVAADTSPWRGDASRQWRTNVIGTEAVIDACRTQGVGRLVHVSTVAVWGHHAGPVCEDTPQKGEEHWVGYVRSKYEAEQRVKAAHDLSRVICNPGHVLGRYDAGNWGRLFRMIKDSALPGVPPGAGSFANGRQVAEALVHAAARGRDGENYLLGGPYLSFQDLAAMIAHMVGRQAPKPLPAFALKTLGQINDWISRFTRKAPDLTPESAYFVCHKERIDSARAIKELGYQEIPVHESLKDCYDWQITQGLL